MALRRTTGLSRRAQERLDRIAAELAPSPDASSRGGVQVTADALPRRKGKPGPLPGLAILRSPHRDEINALLFIQRLSFTDVERICRERYGLRISRRQVRNYYYAYRDTVLADLVETPGAIVLSRVERDVANDWRIMNRIMEHADRLIDAGKVTMRHIIEILRVRQAYLGEHSAIELLTAEERYGKALQAILRILMAECDEATRARIQAAMMRDPDILAALDTSDTVDSDARLLEDGEDADVAASTASPPAA